MAHFHLGWYVSSHKMNFVGHRGRRKDRQTGPDQRSSTPGVATRKTGTMESQLSCVWGRGSKLVQRIERGTGNFRRLPWEYETGQDGRGEIPRPGAFYAWFGFTPALLGSHRGMHPQRYTCMCHTETYLHTTHNTPLTHSINW